MQKLQKDNDIEGCCHDDNFGYLYDDVPNICSRSTFILLYITTSFTSDLELRMFKNEIVKRGLNQPGFLIPIWAASEAELKDDNFIRECFGVSSLRGVDPSDEFDVNKLKKQLVKHQLKKPGSNHDNDGLVTSMDNLHLSD